MRKGGAMMQVKKLVGAILLSNLLLIGCAASPLVEDVKAVEKEAKNSCFDGQARSSEEEWRKHRQDCVRQALMVQTRPHKAKNIILFIADGQGVTSSYLSRLWQGQLAGGYGDEYVQSFEKFPHLALAKTYSLNGQTPDSAATATAILSGVKTRNGVIGMDAKAVPGACDAKGKIPSIADLFSAKGRSVGVISTAPITHATPAAAYANSSNRSWQSDERQPENCQVKDIASQLGSAIQAGSVDIALGGGRAFFLPQADLCEEDQCGKRKDGRDLVAELRIKQPIRYVENREDLRQLDMRDPSPILGLFTAFDMNFELLRKESEPSMTEMTGQAINYLDQNEEGYFLLVEAGRVDHANHATRPSLMVADSAAFAKAVAKAVAKTDPRETLIIVTADHAHSVAAHGYCGRGTPVLGQCFQIDRQGISHKPEPELAADGQAVPVIGYLSGENAVVEHLEMDAKGKLQRKPLKQEALLAPDARGLAALPRPYETHSGVDVAVYARGPYAHLIRGVMEQSTLFEVMHYAAFEEFSSE